MTKRKQLTLIEKMREAEGSDLAQTLGFWTAKSAVAVLTHDEEAYEYANAGAVRALTAMWVPESPPLRADGRALEPWGDIHG